MNDSPKPADVTDRFGMRVITDRGRGIILMVGPKPTSGPPRLVVGLLLFCSKCPKAHRSHVLEMGLN